MNNNYADNALVFKALADENRLKIFELLAGGEKCGNELLDAVQISQSTLSHHLKVMCASGIVKSRKDGTKTIYSISRDGAYAATELLSSILIIDDNSEEASPPVTKVKQSGSRPNGWLL